MSLEIVELVAELARRRRIELAPSWANNVPEIAGGPSLEQLLTLSEALGWAAPLLDAREPGPADFPLLVFSDKKGWALAEQWEAPGLLRIVAGGQSALWSVVENELTYAAPVFPASAAARSPQRALPVFIDAMWRQKQAVINSVLATVVINVLALGVSFYTMQVYDRVVPSAGYATLWVLTFGVAIAAAFDFVLRVVRSNMLERASADADKEISEFFFARALAVRLDAGNGEVGTMAGQLRGYDQVRSLLSSASVFALADLPFALLFVWVIFMLAGEVALVVLLSFTISIALAFVFARLIRKQADGVQVGTTRKNGLMVEVLDAAETIKANRAGWSMLARWNRLMALVEVDDFDMRRLSAIAQATSGTIQQIAYVGLISWGAIEVIDGKMTVGALIAASIIAGRVNGPLVLQLPAMIVQASYAKAALKGLDSFLKLPVDREPDVEYLRPEQLRSEVRLEKVAFMYKGARSGLAVEELKISPGERVGIIGPVGSGKSTLLKVMAGLFPPQSGVVYLSDLDLNQIAEDQLRRHVGYVGQEFRLVNGSLREQLTFGISDPGDDAILAAAEATGLNKLISAHPKGLELPISEGGRGVSGGQRALVGLTRLMLAKPKILLLDEPTAALDQETEEQALRAIVGNLETNDALVMVTHKISLLNMVQRLIVVVNGKIIFDGPTAAVLQKLSPASANAKAPVAANTQKVTI